MKRIVSLIVAVLLMGQISIVAFAHGSEKGHGHNEATTVRGLCNLEGCSKSEVHRHGGKYYDGHSMGDGHDYHSFCNVEGCALTGVHQHDGAYYFGHALEDGHDYHAVCSVEGCTETHDACLHHNGGNGHLGHH